MNHVSYIVQASPLAKLGVSPHREMCLKDPSYLYDKKPFDVIIPRPTGAIKLTHLVPEEARNLIPHSKNRVIKEDEIGPLVHFLTSDGMAETDIYGVVSIDVGKNVIDNLLQMVISGDTSKMADLVRESKYEMARSLERAIELADERVKRACWKTYSIVQATRDDMKKNNSGVYSPSVTEALAFKVLEKSIMSARAPEVEAARMVEDAVGRIHNDVYEARKHFDMGASMVNSPDYVPQNVPKADEIEKDPTLSGIGETENERNF
jgi:hypothetical protein